MAKVKHLIYFKRYWCSNTQKTLSISKNQNFMKENIQDLEN